MRKFKIKNTGRYIGLDYRKPVEYLGDSATEHGSVELRAIYKEPHIVPHHDLTFRVPEEAEEILEEGLEKEVKSCFNSSPGVSQIQGQIKNKQEDKKEVEIYQITGEEVRQLSSHSKTARKFFAQKFPGSTLQRFYYGSIYRNIDTGTKYLLGWFVDSDNKNKAILISLETGNMCGDPKTVKGSEYTYFERETAERVFGNLSQWEKVDA